MPETASVISVLLPAPPEQVFWDLLDPSSVPTYDSHIQDWTPREHPLKIGTLIDYRARVGRLWLRASAKLVAFDPPSHLEAHQVEPPLPFRSRLTWDLEDEDGGTRLTYRLALTGPPLTGPIRRSMLGLLTSHLATEVPALADRYRANGVGADRRSQSYRQRP
jgi:uncharacterized protein YndB with AHSA1/START domain